MHQQPLDLCGLCDLAHFSSPEACPQLQSVDEMQRILDQLKKMEKGSEVELAKELIVGRIMAHRSALDKKARQE